MDNLKTNAGTIWVIILFPVAFLAFTAILTYHYFLPDISNKEFLMNRTARGVVLLDRRDRPFFTFYQGNLKEYAPIRSIPKEVQEALIASEDKDYYSHQGYSIKSIARALFTDIKNKNLSYGGSTITQQLVKNALLNNKKTFMRKYQEIILATQIETKYSKDEILELYLNSVYFGEGSFGINEAAQNYFSKDAKDLNLSESSLLVALLPAPSKLSPFSGNLDEVKLRQKIILQLMMEQEYITSEEKTQAENYNLVFKPKDDLNKLGFHFALMVRDRLLEKYTEEELARSGMIVTTTLDLDYQEYAEKIVNQNVTQRLRLNRATNASVVVMDPKTGEILSMVGSYNWFDDKFGKFNVALSPRQPGSSFKPIVYAAAMEKKIISPATILRDSPTTFARGYRPNNYDGRFRGPVTARRALANSLNIPAVEVITKVGVEESMEMAKRMGITTLVDPANYGPSLVLGAGEVPLLEMVEAYSVFANYGVRITPYSIIQIENRNREIIFSNSPQIETVLDPGVAFLISSILSDNRARAEQFGNNLTISRPAAVKTGTTEFYKDAWTIGYTPSLAIGVWVGNNDGQPMDQIAGSLGAAPIWRNLMEHYLSGTPVENFTPPPSVIQATLCLRSNSTIPREATRSALPSEYFLEGSQPNYYCQGTRVPQGGSRVTPTPQPPATRSPQLIIPTLSITPSPTTTPSPTPRILTSPPPTRTPSPSITPSVKPIQPTQLFNPLSPLRESEVKFIFQNPLTDLPWINQFL